MENALQKSNITRYNSIRYQWASVCMLCGQQTDRRSSRPGRAVASRKSQVDALQGPVVTAAVCHAQHTPMTARWHANAHLPPQTCTLSLSMYEAEHRGATRHRRRVYCNVLDNAALRKLQESSCSAMKRCDREQLFGTAPTAVRSFVVAYSTG